MESIHASTPAEQDYSPPVTPSILPADDDFDVLLEQHRSLGRSTMILLGAIVLALVFCGGVLVQKDFGGSSTSGAAGAAPGGAAPGGGSVPSGFPSGGFPGGGVPGQAGGGAAATAAPVVVGTVTRISGSKLTVKNFAGENVTVKVPAGASITLIAGKKLTALEAGVTVSVAGKTATDRTVTASSVTVRTT